MSYRRNERGSAIPGGVGKVAPRHAEDYDLISHQSRKVATQGPPAIRTVARGRGGGFRGRGSLQERIIASRGGALTPSGSGLAIPPTQPRAYQQQQQPQSQRADRDWYDEPFTARPVVNQGQNSGDRRWEYDAYAGPSSNDYSRSRSPPLPSDWRYEGKSPAIVDTYIPRYDDYGYNRRSSSPSSSRPAAHRRYSPSAPVANSPPLGSSLPKSTDTRISHHTHFGSSSPRPDIDSITTDPSSIVPKPPESGSLPAIRPPDSFAITQFNPKLGEASTSTIQAPAVSKSGPTHTLPLTTSGLTDTKHDSVDDLEPAPKMKFKPLKAGPRPIDQIRPVAVPTISTGSSIPSNVTPSIPAESSRMHAGAGEIFTPGATTSKPKEKAARSAKILGTSTNSEMSTDQIVDEKEDQVELPTPKKNKTKQKKTAVPSVPTESIDVKPDISSLPLAPSHPIADDLGRNEGVLAIMKRDIPEGCWSSSTAIKTKARKSLRSEKAAELKLKGRRVVKTYWRDDGLAMSWVRNRTTPVSIDGSRHGSPMVEPPPESAKVVRDTNSTLNGTVLNGIGKTSTPVGSAMARPAKTTRIADTAPDEAVQNGAADLVNPFLSAPPHPAKSTRQADTGLEGTGQNGSTHSVSSITTPTRQIPPAAPSSSSTTAPLPSPTTVPILTPFPSLPLAAQHHNGTEISTYTIPWPSHLLTEAQRTDNSAEAVTWRHAQWIDASQPDEEGFATYSVDFHVSVEGLIVSRRTIVYGRGVRAFTGKRTSNNTNKIPELDPDLDFEPSAEDKRDDLPTPSVLPTVPNLPAASALPPSTTGKDGSDPRPASYEIIKIVPYPAELSTRTLRVENRESLDSWRQGHWDEAAEIDAEGYHTRKVRILPRLEGLEVSWRPFMPDEPRAVPFKIIKTVHYPAELSTTKLRVDNQDYLKSWKQGYWEEAAEINAEGYPLRKAKVMTRPEGLVVSWRPFRPDEPRKQAYGDGPPSVPRPGGFESRDTPRRPLVNNCASTTTAPRDGNAPANPQLASAATSTKKDNTGDVGKSPTWMAVGKLVKKRARTESVPVPSVGHKMPQVGFSKGDQSATPLSERPRKKAKSALHQPQFSTEEFQLNATPAKNGKKSASATPVHSEQKLSKTAKKRLAAKDPPQPVNSSKSASAGPKTKSKKPKLEPSSQSPVPFSSTLQSLQMSMRSKLKKIETWTRIQRDYPDQAMTIGQQIDRTQDEIFDLDGEIEKEKKRLEIH